MKQLLTILFSLIALVGYGQFPNNQSNSSPTTLFTSKGGLTSPIGYVEAVYGDTAAANLNPYIRSYPGARIRIGNMVWMRDATATKWLNITGTVTNLIDNSTRLVYGTATLDTLLTYDVSDAGYFILGNYYTSAATQVTFSAADATLDRIDVIYLDTSGQVGIITGTASVFPVKPTVDASTQIELTFVTIGAASTTVDDVTSTVIYNENTEWTGNSDLTGYDLDYATDPYSGSVSVDIPSFSGGEYLDFTNSTSLDITDYQYLKLYIRLHEAFSATDFISVYLLSTETQVTQPVNIINGAYGFNGSTVADYMVVAIPISSFSVVQNMGFNRVRFIFNGASATGLQIDKIVVHSGYSNPPPTAGGVLSFNGRTGHVLPMFEDYEGYYQDTTYAMGDSLKFKKGNILWGIKFRDSTKVVDVNGDPSPFFRARPDSAGYNWLFYDTTGLGGSSGTTYTANAPIDITGSVISADTTRASKANLATQHYADSMASVISGSETHYMDINNTAVGVNVLSSRTTGNGNTGVGVNALLLERKGNGNTAIGYQAMIFDTTGTGNTALGSNALAKSRAGDYNTAVGYKTIDSLDNGNYNTALGYLAGIDLLAGQRNTFLGTFSTGSTTSINDGIALGYGAHTTSKVLGITDSIYAIKATGISKGVDGYVLTDSAGHFIASPPGSSDSIVASYLKVESTTQASMPFPVMSQAQRDAIVPSVAFSWVYNADVGRPEMARNTTGFYSQLAFLEDISVTGYTNGVTAIGTLAALGGSLTQNTNIDPDAYNFSITPVSGANGIHIDNTGYTTIGDGVLGMNRTHLKIDDVNTYAELNALTVNIGDYQARQNSTVIGVNDTNSKITLSAANGIVIGVVAEYADNAAAIAGGLAVGTIYRTGDNLKIVH